MLDVTSPVIQVITVGTDWPAIIAVISTGLVGLAGIGSAIWQARRTWNIEDNRAKIAEKRRIYAACIAALSAHNLLARQKGLFKDSSTKGKRPPEYQTVWQESINAVGEINLIAPPDVTTLANKTGAILARPEQEDQGTALKVIVDLLKAMRKDLGE